MDEGFTHIKMKVGRDLEDDKRRLRIAREVIGDDRYLMIDANKVWEVGEAIREAVAPVKVATGEMCQNRIAFKQMISGARSTSCRSTHAAWAG